jgi:23S rRNA (uracil1939-C5)-methyltransferase
MIEVLKKAPKKIIYISCNPLTQVQDIRILGKRYVVKDNFGIDLFPQTVHVESVLILERV